MWLLIGLGNPGSDYAGHRHNVGFMAIDEIVRRHGFSAFKSRFRALVSEGALAGEKVLTLKPQTYMNRSGQAAQEAAAYFKIPLERIVVFYDEIDLAPGKVRIKTGGGSAGHNGVRSLDAHLGNGFKRVRIGVGHPGHKDLVHGYVLHDFSKADAIWLQPLLEAIADSADEIVAGRDAEFLNRIALATRGEDPRKTTQDESARER